MAVRGRTDGATFVNFGSRVERCSRCEDLMQMVEARWVTARGAFCTDCGPDPAFDVGGKTLSVLILGTWSTGALAGILMGRLCI